MSARYTRRHALQSAAAVGAGFWLGASPRLRAASPNEKLNVACIGVGGRGAANVGGLAKENLVAFCDVDGERAKATLKRFPKVKLFEDYRRMFDAMHQQIDAVVVSTPDHTHFHPSMAALQLDKHLYCEKPLAHNVWEARQLTDVARQRGLATQLGCQRHAIGGMRRIVEVVQSGAIGAVQEAHSWVGGSRGMPSVPTEGMQVPSHLAWDLWLGPAQQRPYHKTYCPYGWRFWWDFGTGETGNWGCHILDIPFWALDLKYPTHVSASGPAVHPQTTPKQMQVTYEFPARGKQPPVKLHWYHASSGPDVLRELDLPARGNNTLLIGSEGMLLCGFGNWKLYPEEKFADYQPPEQRIPGSPGFHNEWIRACKGGEPATCHFDYSGPLAETVLLGNVAYRAGEAFEWKADTLEASSAAAQDLIRAEYRQGWQVAG